MPERLCDYLLIREYLFATLLPNSLRVVPKSKTALLKMYINLITLLFLKRLPHLLLLPGLSSSEYH